MTNGLLQKLKSKRIQVNKIINELQYFPLNPSTDTLMEEKLI